MNARSYPVRIRIVVALLSFTIVSIAFSQVFDTQHVPKAYACTPATPCEINPAVLTPLAIISGTAPLTTANTLGSFTISNVLNGIAWAVAKAAVQAITKSIVMWINSGFQGSPAFVTDLQAYLTATADHIAGTLIAELAGSDFICSPFRLQLTDLLRNQYYGGLFLNRCTLTGIQNNLQNFTVTTNFGGSGGWAGWLSLTTSPQNNFFGAYYAAADQLSLKLINSRGQSMSLLDWGHGFMSWCGSGNTTTGNTVNLGDSQEAGKDLNTVGVRAAATSPAKTCTNSDGTPGSIQTPGSVIENQLEFQLGSGVRQLELANSINEIVGALMQQLVVKALGATGLFGLSSPSSGGGSSFIDQLGSSTQPTGNEIPALTELINTSATGFQTYKKDWQKIQGAAQDAKDDLNKLADSCRNDKDDAQNAIDEQVQPVLDESVTNLDMASTSIATIQVLQAEASSTASIDDLANLGNDYQTFTNSGTALTAGDVQEAETDSASTEGSLYAQMRDLSDKAKDSELVCSLFSI